MMIGSGDHQGFDLAFDELFASAREVALRVVRSEAEAEDLAAEACARALVHWRRVGGLPYRRAWVCRVAANLAMDLVRHRRRPVPDLRATDPPMEDRVQTRIALAAALAKLSRRQREALVLRYAADLTENEVAEVLGVSRGSVRVHIQRGLIELRSFFGGTFDVEVNGNG